MERTPSDSTSTGSTIAGLVVLVTLIEIMRLISALPLPILSSSYFEFVYRHWASTTVPWMTCWHAGFQRGIIDPDATVNSESETLTASINLNNSVLDCPELSMISTSQVGKSLPEFSSSSSLSNNGLNSSNYVLLVNLPESFDIREYVIHARLLRLLIILQQQDLLLHDFCRQAVFCQPPFFHHPTNTRPQVKIYFAC